MRNLLLCLCWLLPAAPLPSAHAADAAGTSLSVAAADGVQIPVQRFAARGSTLLLWLPSESGVSAAEPRAGRELAQKSLETWVADLHAARFLPGVASSMDQLTPEDVARVIQRAAETGKDLVLISSERGAPLALSGALAWRQGRSAEAEAAARIKGMILFSPNFYGAAPEPGKEPAFVPVTAQNPFPVSVLQPTYSPWYWRVEELKGELEKTGGRMHPFYLQGVRDRFYFRPDASAEEMELAEKLSGLVERALTKIGVQPR